VQAGGAESNVAVGAARLGADAVWLSKLPESPLGRRIIGELRSHGVRTGVSWADPEASRLGTYYLEHGGEPRGTNVIYDRADAAITTVTPAELPTGALEAAEYFHTTGITPALSERAAETTTALLRAAGDAGATRSFDLNYRAKLWDPETARAAYEDLFEHVDTLFVPGGTPARYWTARATRSRSLTGSRPRSTSRPWSSPAARRAPSRSGTARCTSRASSRPTPTTRSAPATRSSPATYLAKRIDGGEMADSLEWAAAAAALKRTVDGDLAVITPGDVESVVDGAGGINR